MALVVPNTADVLMLEYIVNKTGQDGGSPTAGGDRVLRLFTNNLTPGKSSVLANLTEPSGATGYAVHTMPGSGWSTSSVAGVNSAQYSGHTFSFTTAVTCYGFFITTSGGSPSLLWIERFSTAPYTLPSGGGEIAISPRINAN